MYGWKKMLFALFILFLELLWDAYYDDLIEWMKRRKINKMNIQELEIEKNMLIGNIDRICVTDNEKELDSMYYHTMRRIKRIYDYNLSRILTINKIGGGDKFEKD